MNTKADIKETFKNINNSVKKKQNFTNFSDFDLFFRKFTNLLMIHGKKTKASKIIFNMLIILKKKIKKDFEKNSYVEKKETNRVTPNFTFFASRDIQLHFTLLHVISKAIENVMPSLQVRKVRVAGSTYMVPVVLSKKKQENMAIKWIIESAKKRQKNSKIKFSICLADEMLDASRKIGQARQKRDDLHRLAQMNRAYIRYRWW